VHGSRAGQKAIQPKWGGWARGHSNNPILDNKNAIRRAHGRRSIQKFARRPFWRTKVSPLKKKNEGFKVAKGRKDKVIKERRSVLIGVYQDPVEIPPGREKLPVLKERKTERGIRERKKGREREKRGERSMV